jgi:hypothetical protein
MATIQIADNDARVQYTQAVTANTTQLTIDFPFFDLDDINVIVTDSAGNDTTLTRGTGTGTFAVTGTAVDDGFSGGYITLGDTYVSTTTYTIFRDIDIERTTDFPTSGPFNISSLNTELDKIFAIEQELETRLTRTVKLADSDASANLNLPNLNTRKGTVLAFNSTTGIPEAGPNIGQLTTIAAISADIGTLADIEDGTVATDAISDLAAIASNVTTVAGISTNVSTVAGISANVTTVAGNTSNINTVAGISANVTSVAGVSANVTTVAGISSDVTTVAGDSTDIQSLAAVSSQIGLLGTSAAIADMNTLGTAAIVADMDALADISTDIDNLGGITSDVTAVAGITANVTTVAGISANVTSVAGISSDVTSVAGITSDVTTVASNDTNITTVATNISGVNSFADRYRVGATNPSSSLNEGDLFYNTTDDVLKYYNGTSWQNIQAGITQETDPNALAFAIALG